MAVTYVVRPGDTLSGIIKKSGGSWLQQNWRDRIMDLNPHIKDPNRINVNQLVLVPEKPDEIVLQAQVDYVSKVQNAMCDPFLRREIQRLASGEDQIHRRNFITRFDQINALKGSDIIYYGPDGAPVYIRKTRRRRKVIIYETRGHFKTEAIKDKFIREVFGAALAGGAAILGIFAIGLGVGLTPFSAGTSNVLTVIGLAAVGASTCQAVIGGYRAGKIYWDNSTKHVDWLDSIEFYTYACLALDAISLAGVTGSVGTSVKGVLILKNAAKGKTFFEILKGMTRHERKRLAEALARINQPGLSNTALKEMVRHGRVPKRYEMRQISRQTQSQVIDLFGAGASTIGSGLSGVINRAGSSVAILYADEVPQ